MMRPLSEAEEQAWRIIHHAMAHDCTAEEVIASLATLAAQYDGIEHLQIMHLIRFISEA